MNSKFGSLWRKWDLHIHTDASDGKGTCEEILKEAANLIHQYGGLVTVQPALSQIVLTKK